MKTKKIGFKKDQIANIFGSGWASFGKKIVEEGSPTNTTSQR